MPDLAQQLLFTVEESRGRFELVRTADVPRPVTEKVRQIGQKGFPRLLACHPAIRANTIAYIYVAQRDGDPRSEMDEWLKSIWNIHPLTSAPRPAWEHLPFGPDFRLEQMRNRIAPCAAARPGPLVDFFWVTGGQSMPRIRQRVSPDALRHVGVIGLLRRTSTECENHRRDYCVIASQLARQPHSRLSYCFDWWAHKDSNLRPAD